MLEHILNDLTERTAGAEVLADSSGEAQSVFLSFFALLRLSNHRLRNKRNKSQNEGRGAPG